MMIGLGVLPGVLQTRHELTDQRFETIATGQES